MANGKIKPGVYIGKNIELAVTEKYTLIFLAREETLMTFLIHNPDGQCIHVVKTEQEHGHLEIEYLLTRQGGMNYVKGKNLLNFRGWPAAELAWKEGTLRCFFPFLEEEFTAEIAECLTEESLVPKNMAATADNLAECLQQWHLGVYELVSVYGNKSFFEGIILNTPKHMYIYKARESGQIYIRAARYRCDSKGIAFHQNYRQFYEADHPASAHHVILTDNRASMQELEINTDYFVPNTCNLDQNTFYWSVRKYTQNQILLNGCGGETYYWSPGKHTPD